MTSLPVPHSDQSHGEHLTPKTPHLATRGGSHTGKGQSSFWTEMGRDSAWLFRLLCVASQGSSPDTFPLPSPQTLWASSSGTQLFILDSTAEFRSCMPRWVRRVRHGDRVTSCNARRLNSVLGNIGCRHTRTLTTQASRPYPKSAACTHTLTNT